VKKFLWFIPLVLLFVVGCQTNGNTQKKLDDLSKRLNKVETAIKTPAGEISGDINKTLISLNKEIQSIDKELKDLKADYSKFKAETERKLTKIEKTKIK